jgi:hypothetical protein
MQADNIHLDLAPHLHGDDSLSAPPPAIRLSAHPSGVASPQASLTVGPPREQAQ